MPTSLSGPRPVVVIKCGDPLVPSWVQNLTPLLPEFEVVGYNGSYEPDNVRYVVGWKPDAVWINGFANVRAVASIGSGVDHIAHLDELRKDIPVLRTVSDDLVQRMREFVTLCVLSWHRQLPGMLDDTRDRRWVRHAVPTADKVSVGVLGFGSMGQAAAAAIRALGYDVAVWASSERSDTPYPYFRGRGGLDEIASRSDVVICMLPLTRDTANILDRRLFGKMRTGGCLINLGRGGHVVDDDLLQALREQRLSAAYLDAFRTEPLPETSVLWDAPGVVITGHSAAYISPEVGPHIVAGNLLAFEEGELITPVYRPDVGY
jgi:glyoxylate/hydroxypyruvate reductase A